MSNYKISSRQEFLALAKLIEENQRYNIGIMKERETSKSPKWFQDFLVMYKQDVSEQKKFNAKIESDISLIKSLPTIKKEIAELKNNK